MFKFSLLDLFLVTASAAVAIFLYTIGWKWLVPVWLAGVFGYEIGKRSAYSLVLVVMVGMVLGLWVSLAIYLSGGAFDAIHESTTIKDVPRLLVIGLLFFWPWIICGLITIWMIRSTHPGK